MINVGVEGSIQEYVRDDEVCVVVVCKSVWDL